MMHVLIPGWSIQRHVSTKGLAYLLQMLSTGGTLDTQQESYMIKMGHDSISKEADRTGVYKRNVTFLKKYLQVVDEKGALKEDYIKACSTLVGAQNVIYQAAYERILAFKLMVQIIEETEGISFKNIRRELTKRLLSETAKELPEAYEKKIKQLNKNYGSHEAWQYPHPSLDRLVEIARLSGRLVDHKSNFSMAESPVGTQEESSKMILSDFRIAVLDFCDYKRKEGKYITSIDEIRNDIVKRHHLLKEKFDRMMSSLILSDPKMIPFRGQMDGETGLELPDGTFVYRINYRG